MGQVVSRVPRRRFDVRSLRTRRDSIYFLSPYSFSETVRVYCYGHSARRTSTETPKVLANWIGVYLDNTGFVYTSERQRFRLIFLHWKTQRVTMQPSTQRPFQSTKPLSFGYLFPLESTMFSEASKSVLAAAPSIISIVVVFEIGIGSALLLRWL